MAVGRRGVSHLGRVPPVHAGDDAVRRLRRLVGAHAGASWARIGVEPGAIRTAGRGVGTRAVLAGARVRWVAQAMLRPGPVARTVPAQSRMRRHGRPFP